MQSVSEFLLDALREDRSPTVRYQALKGLLSIDVPRDIVDRVTDAIHRLLDDREPDPPLQAAIWRATSRWPSESVRSHLVFLLERVPEESRLELLKTLGRVGDERCLRPLMGMIRADFDNEEAMHALAMCPLEKWVETQPGLPESIPSDAEDPMARFWLGIARARAGDMALWRQVPNQPGGVPLFRGDPAWAQHVLRELGPMPAHFVDEVLRERDHDEGMGLIADAFAPSAREDSSGGPVDSEAAAPAPVTQAEARALVESSESLEWIRLTRKAARQLRSLPPDEAASFETWLAETMADAHVERPAQTGFAASFGNSFVGVAANLTRDRRSDVRALYTAFTRVESQTFPGGGIGDITQQLCWVLSRTPWEELLLELSPWLKNPADEVREHAWATAVGTAVWRDALHGPVFGAGGDSPPELPPPPDLLMPDEPQASMVSSGPSSAPPDGSPAPSAPPPDLRPAPSPPPPPDATTDSATVPPAPVLSRRSRIGRFVSSKLRKFGSPVKGEPVLGDKGDKDLGGRELGDALSPAPAPAPTPHHAFADVAAPESVRVQEEFLLDIGLAKEPTQGTTPTAMELPPLRLEPYEIGIQIHAHGFEIVADGDWNFSLEVSLDSPYPRRSLRVKALETDDGQTLLSSRLVTVHFLLENQLVGTATRTIRVESAGGAPMAAPDAMPVAIRSRPGADVDLTIIVTQGNDDDARMMLWNVSSPHVSIDVDPRKLRKRLPEDRKQYARSLIERVGAEPNDTVRRFLSGEGKILADLVPPAVWKTMKRVADHVGHAPTVLLATDETIIPWELSWLPEPVRSDAPQFLGTQVTIGRWVLPPDGEVEPPLVQETESIVVVSGDYSNTPGWSNLEHARTESEKLVGKYSARPVEASRGNVIKVLDGEPKGDVLHFALHGVLSGDQGTRDGLVLPDDATVGPAHVRGTSEQIERLVFLNACQVGTGWSVLGLASGMAAAFLRTGASAVIAPLWSVGDEAAGAIALRFYEQVFSGKPAAEALRETRAEFDSVSDADCSTYLAYQFFGHPTLTLNRTE